MAWSTDGLQYTYTETTESGGTITYVDTYDTAYAQPGSKIVATSWSDTSGNSSSISWEVLASNTAETYDNDGVKSTATVSAAGLLKESGSVSWTYVDDAGTSQTSTLAFTHYFNNDTDWTHLGGFETDENAVTTYFKAGFDEAYQVRELSGSVPQLTSSDGIAFELYGDARYIEETFTGWNGQDVVEATFYNADGDVIGAAVQNTDTWTVGDDTETATNTGYEDADGNWLGSEWSDSNGNNGWYFSAETTDVTEPGHLDLNGNGSQGEGDITLSSAIIVEMGQDSWSYTDYEGVTVTETRSYTHYYTTGYEHLGGVEEQNGETIKYGAGWTFEGVEKDLTGLTTLDGVNDDIAKALYSSAGDGTDVVVDTESWVGWNDQLETETTYYDVDSGEKLGSSLEMTDSWTEDGETVTWTNKSYNDADWNYLGNQWSDSDGNSGSNYETQLTSDFSETTTIGSGSSAIDVDLDLDGDSTAGGTFEIADGTAVTVREGSDSFSFQMGDETITESITYKHYYLDTDPEAGGYLDDSAHIGGFEIRNGETTIYEAGFTRGAVKRDVSGAEVLSADDGISYELFGGAKYIEEERLGWNGETEVETTYYNSDGAEVGRSFTNINKWTDYYSGDEVVSTNTGYEDADGNWLGSEWSDSNGNNGWYFSAETTDVTEPGHLDLNGNGSQGEGDITLSSAIIVEMGQDSWSYTDYEGVTVTETRSYTHYYTTGYEHLGGVEEQNGETIKYGAGWTFEGVEKDLTGLTTLDGVNDDIAKALYSSAGDGTDVVVDTESWVGWNDQLETETTYYDVDSGEKLGSSLEMTDSWTEDGETVTWTNKSYNDADWNYLGNQWSDSDGNSGSNYETQLTSDFSETTTIGSGLSAIVVDLDLNGDSTAGGTFEIADGTAVTVREGSDSFSFQMGDETITESITYKHYYLDTDPEAGGYLDDSAHIGGFEIRNGETTIYEAGFTRGAVKRDVSDANSLIETDGISYELFGGAKYIEEERLGWNGETEVETTYYNSDGAEVGRSFTNINKWTDYYSGDDVVSTNTGYEDADGNWLGSEWSDSNGNNGWYFSAETTDVTEPGHLDLNGNGSQGEGDITLSSAIIVEMGQDSWSYTDYEGVTVTETRSYTHYYTTGYEHLGGVEEQNGETIKYGAGWTFEGVEKDLTGLTTLDGVNDDIAKALYSSAGDGTDVVVDTESWVGWNDQLETETTYYDVDSGEKLGSSLEMTDSWTEDGETVTWTNKSYNDADWNYLGNQWSDSDGNSGSNYETQLTSDFSETTTIGSGSSAIDVDLDLDGDSTAGGTFEIADGTAVTVREGSDSFSFQMGDETITESITYKHYYLDTDPEAGGYLDDSAHIGGFEIRNGETTIYEAGFTRGAVKRDVSGAEVLSADDGISYELFGGAKYIEEERLGWNGETEVETTYYNSDGAEVGRSFTNINKWTDYYSGEEVVSTNTGYEDADSNWLGSESSDSNGNNNWSFSAETTDVTEPGHLDLNGNGSQGEGAITLSSAIIVEMGQDTWSYTDYEGVPVTETRSYTHYYTTGDEHLGGVEEQNGETIKYGAGWTFEGVEKDLTGLTTLDGVNDDIAKALYSSAGDGTDVVVDTESWVGWNDQLETETTYYDATTREKLGSSLEMKEMDGQTILYSNKSYNDADWNYLGNQWSDSDGNSGSNYETQLTSDFSETTTIGSGSSAIDVDLDLNGDSTAGGTYAVTAGTPITVVERSDSFSFQMGSETITESLVSKHYYIDDGDGFLEHDEHIGGFEIRNGETTIFEAGFTQGAKTRDVGGLPALTSAIDSVAYDAFEASSYGSGLVYASESRTSWDGGTETEVTYYDASNGAEIGRSFEMSGQFQNWDGSTINYEHSRYETFSGEELASSFADTDSSGNIIRAGSRIEKLTTLTSEPSWLDINGNGTSGESSVSIEVIQETGSETFSFFDGTTNQTETFTFTHYLDKDTRDHLGGSETRGDVVEQYGPGFEWLGQGEGEGGGGSGEHTPGPVTPVAGADYTLGTTDNIQATINGAVDVDGDGKIVIALTGGRYAQDFTIDKSIEIWGAAKGLSISEDGNDNGTLVDEVEEVNFDLENYSRGVNETWIDGTVTVAHDQVLMDGLRLHTYDGALKFAGSDIDYFTLQNSYVTGFHAGDSFKYYDEDGIKSKGWLLDGNLIGGVSGGVGGSLYLTGIEDSLVVDNVFWRPGAAHMYIEDVTNVKFESNFFLQGLHADGANQDGLYGELIDADNWGYAGFSHNVGYGYGYGYGFGPDGYGPIGYGPEGYGPDGYGPDGYGPDGYGPDGYGPGGYGYQVSSLDYYGRNYVAEVKGVTDGVQFVGNTAKYNSGGIQFWDENSNANYFTDTVISDNVFTDFFNADPNGLLSAWDSRHKSGIVGGVVVSVVEGSSTDNFTIDNNEFIGSISEIYNADDIDALIQIQGGVNDLYISNNTLDWEWFAGENYDGTSAPSGEVFTQGVYLAGDITSSISSTGPVLIDNEFDTDVISSNYSSVALVIDKKDYSSEELGSFSEVVQLVGHAVSAGDLAQLGNGADEWDYYFGEYSNQADLGNSNIGLIGYPGITDQAQMVNHVAIGENTNGEFVVVGENFEPDVGDALAPAGIEIAPTFPADFATLPVDWPVMVVVEYT